MLEADQNFYELFGVIAVWLVREMLGIRNTRKQVPAAVRALQEEMDGLTKRVTGLKNSQDEYKALSSRLGALQTQVDGYHLRIREIERDQADVGAEAKAGMLAGDRHEREINALRDGLSGLRSECAEMRGRMNRSNS